MKSAQLLAYDKKNIELTLREAPQPVAGPGQALVRVHAAGVNPLDNMISRGEVKLITPYSLPLIAGNEVVGTIEELHSPSAQFEVGERVFARLPLDSIGAFAEYIAVDLDALAKVPARYSDIEAAAIPLTALTAVQSLALMAPAAGETIFISGGSGGLGAMAIPLAKAQGLNVITNGSASNRERVLALGADRYLDYRTEDYAELLHGVDYVLDSLGGEETVRQMGILKPGGHMVSLRALPNGAFAKRMGLSKFKQLLFSLAGRKLDRLAARHNVRYDFLFVESNGAQLQHAADLLVKDGITPAIDAVFSLDEVNQALDKVANGRSKGKTVLTIAKEL
ncbi:NADP-dependent oxidoreductase [Corynebacterium lizhenjunii]|uniref:NADP-dependent oxidoreductase n=1 Tax=Corynebacterium lizhenjunii TaxID=2709394 RepID=A0A7T0KFR3_9CORY|nr:NADP-dependent oxidoreductase [Corynebacterium lizhenjunii]QPK79724.1 NADP-dependent oxidoreductase [Corynebacterium lizhenjunii]